MAEIPHLAVTARTYNVATDQHITGFEPNPEDMAKLLEVTGRSGDLSVDSLATTIGSGVGWQLEAPDTPLYDGSIVGKGRAEPLTIPDDHTVIRLNIPRKYPITEAEIARRMAAQLLAPARRTNNYARQLPGALAGGTGLVTASLAGAAWWAERQPEVSWSLTGTAGALIAGGIILLREYRDRARQHEIVEFGAAPVLRPIIIHRAATQHRPRPVQQ